MHTIAVILARCVLIAISAMQLAMFLRMIFSFFTTEEDSRFFVFLILLTEPVIIPVRALLSRFRFFAESPIDLSMMIAFLLLSLAGMLLPVVA